MLMALSPRTVILAGAMIALALITAGCWDRKEIEDRGFVLGMAIDHVTTAGPKGQYDLPHVTQEAGQRKYLITLELPRFRKQGEENSATGSDQHYIFAGEGESLYAVTRAIDAQTGLTLFFEDLQVLVISEAVAREGVDDLLDFFFRNAGIRRQVRVFVTPGRAEDILRTKLQVAEVNSTYIEKISHNVKLVPRFASISDLGDIAEAIQNKRPFFMAGIVTENGEVKLTGVAIFKDGKMVEKLDEWEIVGAKIIRKVLKGGVFTVANPANPEKIAAFELAESRIKVDSHIQGDKLSFSLEAEFVGNLVENAEIEQNALDPAFQATLEQALAAEFTRQTLAAYRKQQAMKAEIYDLAGLLHRQHPAYWKTVKSRWDDEVFPNTPLDVKITVIIRRTGMSR